MRTVCTYITERKPSVKRVSVKNNRAINVRKFNIDNTNIIIIIFVVKILIDNYIVPTRQTDLTLRQVNKILFLISTREYLSGSESSPRVLFTSASYI